MKKRTFVLSLLAAGFLAGAVEPAPVKEQVIVVEPEIGIAAPPPAPEAPAPFRYRRDPSNLYVLGRGLTNLATCWLEIPRCMVYDNVGLPVAGLVVGFPDGLLMTAARAASGVFDLATFGFSGDLVHGERFPDLVFFADLTPPEN